MVKVGDWSYPIYLWYWPLIVFAAVLSFEPALASYHWVERPLRSMISRSRPRFAGLVAAIVLPPFVLAGTLGFGASAQWWMTPPTESTSSQDDHVAMSCGCTDQPFGPILCLGGGERSNETVLLAGDSQAYLCADDVINSSALLGMSTIVSSRSGCPFSSLAATDIDSYSCPKIQNQ